jgi:hypothetical protein
MGDRAPSSTGSRSAVDFEARLNALMSAVDEAVAQVESRTSTRGAVTRPANRDGVPTGIDGSAMMTDDGEVAAPPEPVPDDLAEKLAAMMGEADPGQDDAARAAAHPAATPDGDAAGDADREDSSASSGGKQPQPAERTDSRRDAAVSAEDDEDWGDDWRAPAGAEPVDGEHERLSMDLKRALGVSDADESGAFPAMTDSSGTSAASNDDPVPTPAAAPVSGANTEDHQPVADGAVSAEECEALVETTREGSDDEVVEHVPQTVDPADAESSAESVDAALAADASETEAVEAALDHVGATDLVEELQNALQAEPASEGSSTSAPPSGVAPLDEQSVPKPEAGDDIPGDIEDLDKALASVATAATEASGNGADLDLDGDIEEVDAGSSGRSVNNGELDADAEDPDDPADGAAVPGITASEDDEAMPPPAAAVETPKDQPAIVGTAPAVQGTVRARASSSVDADLAAIDVVWKPEVPPRPEWAPARGRFGWLGVAKRYALWLGPPIVVWFGGSSGRSRAVRGCGRGLTRSGGSSSPMHRSRSWNPACAGSSGSSGRTPWRSRWVCGGTCS